MTAFLEVALSLQNAQILPLNWWKAVFALKVTRAAQNWSVTATSSMTVLNASQLVLRISEDECID